MKKVVVICICWVLLAGSAMAGWNQNRPQSADPAKRGRTERSDRLRQIRPLDQLIHSRTAQGTSTSDFREQLRALKHSNRDAASPLDQTGPCDLEDLGSLLGDDIAFGSTIGESNDFGPFGAEPACWQGTWYDADDGESASGPDYAYSWTAPTDGAYTFSLCYNADFEAALVLFHNPCPAAPPVYPADYICGGETNCEDEFFAYPELECIELEEGDEIIIVVDGYVADNFVSEGEFGLSITRCTPCDTECPDDAIVSTEPDCFDGYIDVTNRGCFDYGVDPGDAQIAEDVPCPATICGTSGEYSSPVFGPNWSDEDWYRVVLTEPTTLTACLTFPDGFAGMAILPDDCPVGEVDIITIAYFDGCNSACVSAPLPAGAYYVAAFLADTPCGTPYILEITCGGDPCGLDDPIMVDVSGGLPACQCVTLPCGQTEYTLCFAPLGPDEEPLNGTLAPGCDGSGGAGGPANPCFEECTPTLPFILSEFVYSPELNGWCVLVGAFEPGCFCICLDEVLPVELNSFKAVAGDREITLNWSTASETENDHFDVVRDGVIVGQVNAQNSPTGANYSWHEGNLDNGREYSYSLVAVGVSGTREELAIAAATPSLTNATVTEYALHQNYPNPFNPETSIIFDLIDEGQTTLTVYNPLGQTVATLVNGTMEAGRHTVSFQAAELPSGLYFYRLEAGDFTAVRKMVLMK